jgi:NarL family two-component system response regulator LiaR
MSAEIRLLVVDDHTVVRKGIIAMLDTEPDLTVIGECSNGQEAVDSYDRLKPDVVLMDLVMPVMDGVEAIREIKRTNPKARILVLTSFTSDERVFAAIEAGATGYLLKDSDPEDLVKAIHQVQHGESSLHPMIARKLLNELTQQSAKKKNNDEELTDREVEVLKYIAKGLSNQDIAEQMVVSKPTVHTHVSNILSKLQLSNRTQAALFAIKEGYITFSSALGEEEE